MAIHVIVGTLLCVTVAFLWLRSPRYDDDEPKPIQYTIPILGNAVPWIRDRRKFFDWAEYVPFLSKMSKERLCDPTHLFTALFVHDHCSEKAGRQPFSMLIAGRKHYVFSLPSDVGTIWRKPKAFSIRPFVSMIHKRLFGFNDEEVEVLASITPSLHKAYEKYLLQPEQYEPVVVKYIKDLRLRFQALPNKTSAADNHIMIKDAFNLILDTMANSSVVAYFGQKPVELHPDITKDMSEFMTNGFWPCLSGIPHWLVRSSYNATNRARSALLRGFFDKIGDAGASAPEDASTFAIEHAKLSNSVLDREATGRHAFSFMFGFVNLYAPPLCHYCSANTFQLHI